MVPLIARGVTHSILLVDTHFALTTGKPIIQAKADVSGNPVPSMTITVPPAFGPNAGDRCMMLIPTKANDCAPLQGSTASKANLIATLILPIC
jgi:hypothetical protein